MALESCRECGHQVSTEAAACPSCGVRRPTAAALTGDAARSGERHELLTILYALVAAGIAISLVAWLMK